LLLDDELESPEPSGRVDRLLCRTSGKVGLKMR
jgi:hypothetical protein